MLLPDVNVLIYAHREDSQDHDAYNKWLKEQLDAQAAFGLTGVVLSGFLRITTHPRIFNPPTPLNEALAFVNALTSTDSVVMVQPGSRHWGIFSNLLLETEARGNLVADAWLAAIAIEHACTWISTDRDFSRFPGLNWRHPLHS